MYELIRRKLFSNPTVKDVKEHLETLPDDMQVLCGGVSTFYAHVDTEENYMSYDESNLSEEYNVDDDEEDD